MQLLVTWKSKNPNNFAEIGKRTSQLIRKVRGWTHECLLIDLKKGLSQKYKNLKKGYQKAVLLIDNAPLCP